MPRLSLPGPPYGLLGGVAPRRHRATAWILRDISFPSPRRPRRAEYLSLLAPDGGNQTVSSSRAASNRFSEASSFEKALLPEGPEGTGEPVGVLSESSPDIWQWTVGNQPTRSDWGWVRMELAITVHFARRALITVYIEQGRVRYSLRPAQATTLRLGINASLADPKPCHVPGQMSSGAPNGPCRKGYVKASTVPLRQRLDISLLGFHSMYSDEPLLVVDSADRPVGADSTCRAEALDPDLLAGEAERR